MSDLRPARFTRRSHRVVSAASAIASRVLIDALEARQLLSASPSAAMASDLSTVTFRNQTGTAVAGDYLVNVADSVRFSKSAAKAGFTNIADLGGAGYFSFHTDLTPRQLSRWASQHTGAVAEIAPNFTLATARVPNDPFYTSQYLANNTGQVIPSLVDDTAVSRQPGTAGADLSLEQAWDITTGSADQIAAVIDTGIDVTHDDLAPNIWVNTGETPGDGVDNDGNGFVDDVNGYDFADNDGGIEDTNGHGTAVAGVISATGNNGLGVTGVSWSTKLLGVKVFTSDGPFSSLEGASSSSIIRGVNYITQLKRSGVNIVVANASLGGRAVVYDPMFSSALRSLANAGIVFVAAAGNDASNNDQILFFPSRNVFAQGNALVVAATDNRDQLASFSNFGPSSVDVAAPGVAIFTTASSNVDSFDPFASRATVFDDAGNGYQTIDGTSFSSPAVAGIVALAKAAYPNATPEQVVDAVRRGADKIPALASPSPATLPIVSSGGRANAYNTLKILGNQLIAINSTLGGEWRGRFGASANFVYGSTTGTPTLPFATSTLVPAPATISQAKIKPSDVRAPVAAVGDQRSPFFLESPDPISFSFDFGATTQRLTLYVADLTNSKRAETLRVLDALTGTELASTTLNDFRSGRYVSFDLTGAVTVQLVPEKGQAVLNALFLDPSPTDQSAVVSTARAGDGNFINAFGDQGFVTPGGSTVAPTFATVSTTGSLTVTKGSRNTLLPETLASSKVRSAGLYTSADSFDLTVNISDGSTHRVTFYTYNTGKAARAQRIALVNPASGMVLASEDVTVIRSGSYSTFTVSGTSTFRVTSLGGGPASVAGVFFSGVTGVDTASGNAAEFVGSDSTTGGRYRGVYGRVSATVIGATTPEFTGAGVVTVVAPDTNKTAAPQNPRLTTGNIVAYLATQSSVSIPLDTPVSPTTGSASSSDVRRVSLYFVDFDKKKRSQRVELLDADTGSVISSQIVREFEKGRYLTYDITGDVIVRLTRLTGPTAVISGIFVD